MKKILLNFSILILVSGQTSLGVAEQVFSSFLKENFKITLPSSQSGPIIFYVDEGDSIETDQPLFGIETQSLELQVKQAQLQWQQSESRLNKALSPHAEGVLEKADFVYRQKEVLFQSGAISKDALDLASIEYHLATQPTREEDLAVAELDVQMRYLQLEQARNALEQATFLAPSEAKVHKVLVHENEWVNPGQPVMELIGMHPLHIQVNIPLQEISKIQVGHQLKVKIATGAGEISSLGKVELIASEIDAVSQTVSVKIEVRNENNQFKPGMHANVILP